MVWDIHVLDDDHDLPASAAAVGLDAPLRRNLLNGLASACRDGLVPDNMTGLRLWLIPGYRAEVPLIHPLDAARRIDAMDLNSPRITMSRARLGHRPLMPRIPEHALQVLRGSRGGAAAYIFPGLAWIRASRGHHPRITALDVEPEDIPDLTPDLADILRDIAGGLGAGGTALLLAPEEEGLLTSSRRLAWAAIEETAPALAGAWKTRHPLIGITRTGRSVLLHAFPQEPGPAGMPVGLGQPLTAVRA